MTERASRYFVARYLSEPGSLPVDEVLLRSVSLADGIAEVRDLLPAVRDSCPTEPLRGFELVDEELKVVQPFIDAFGP